MPRFTIKRLLFSTLLIAIGLSYITHPYPIHPGVESYALRNLAAIVLWCGSGSFVGAGIFRLFDKPLMVWVGILIGAIVQFFVLVYLISTLEV
jgi:hypothetical protein